MCENRANVCSPILNDRVNSLYSSFKYSFRVRVSSASLERRIKRSSITPRGYYLSRFIQIPPSTHNRWVLKIFPFDLHCNLNFRRQSSSEFLLISNHPRSKLYSLLYSYF